MAIGSFVINHYAQYVQQFGFGAGSSLYFATKLKRGLLSIDVPGLQYPLALRGGTSDRSAFNEIFIKRWYDHPYPGAPHFIIDAGANVGYASVRFAQLYPDAKVVAVEPDAENFAVLQKNIAPYPHLSGVQGGIWPKSTRLVIENPEAKPWAFRVREAREGEGDFPAVSIADLLRQSGAQTLDILKLDIEGAERELFADPACGAWLERTNMMFVELHDSFKPGCTEALDRAVAPYSFERVTVGMNLVLIRRTLLR